LQILVRVQSCVKPISQIRKEERVLSEGEISKIYLTKKEFQKYASSHKIFKNIPRRSLLGRWGGSHIDFLFFRFFGFQNLANATVKKPLPRLQEPFKNLDRCIKSLGTIFVIVQSQNSMREWNSNLDIIITRSFSPKQVRVDGIQI
jgi:hypothetical protein